MTRCPLYVYVSPRVGATSPHRAMPECISDWTSFPEKMRWKSLYFCLVNRYVETLMGSVFLPTITPSLTDQYLPLCPSQSSMSLPLNNSMRSDLPFFGGTSGASARASGVNRNGMVRISRCLIGASSREGEGSGVSVGTGRNNRRFCHDRQILPMLAGRVRCA